MLSQKMQKRLDKIQTPSGKSLLKQPRIKQTDLSIQITKMANTTYDGGKLRTFHQHQQQHKSNLRKGFFGLQFLVTAHSCGKGKARTGSIWSHPVTGRENVWMLTDQPVMSTQFWLKPREWCHPRQSTQPRQSPTDLPTGQPYLEIHHLRLYPQVISSVKLPIKASLLA